MAKCVLRVCIDAVSGTSVGWGRAQERQRPEITDCTETKERQGLGDAGEGKGWEKKARGRAALTRFSPHREPPGFGPAPCRDPAGLPHLLAQARSLIHQRAGSALRDGGGEGRHPTLSASWGWGVLRGGAESTSKIPRHLFTRGGDTGRKQARRPPPCPLCPRFQGRDSRTPPLPIPLPPASNAGLRSTEEGAPSTRLGLRGGIQELLSYW